MPKYWILRDELYRSLHQWPLIFVFLALGCLAGWGSAYIWPPTYQATAQIYVGLNPYRAFSDTTFLALARPKYSNIDDFKNWQMTQLESVIYLDEFIQETLDTLQATDSYWEKVNQEELRAMLDADWRTAGTWSLVARHPDPQRANQAVEAWSEVAARRVKNAILAAQNTFMVDQQLEAAAAEQLQATLRQAELSSTQKALLNWNRTAQELPEATANQSLPTADRWRILSQATHLAQFTPAWNALLQSQPDASALPDQYITWNAQVASYMDIEISELQQRIHQLEQTRTDLAEQYADESSQSLGLSPNLKIEHIDRVPPKQLRPTGTLIILGGVIGLLAWLFTRLSAINLRPAQSSVLDRN